MEVVREFSDWFMGKARRKDRDGDQTVPDTKPYLDENVLDRKLPDADLRAIVDLPPGLDYNEWLASHTLAIVEHVNLVYGTISEFCTTSGCPDMTGPLSRLYLWFDEKGKKTRYSAPQYIDFVMTFTQKTVTDETIFPTKYANEFPSSFESIARKILRLLYHVIAHMYAAHFREIVLLGLHSHLNLTFAHLTALHRRFNLIDPKETEVLHDLEVALRLTEDSSTSSSSGGGNNNNSGSDSTSTQSLPSTAGSGLAVPDESANGSAAGGVGGVGQTGSGGLATTPLSNQTGAIKCKSSINCGITVASSSSSGVEQQQQQHHQQQHYHHNHQHGDGCGSGCSESMYSGLDIRPPIVNQPESGENNVFT